MIRLPFHPLTLVVSAAALWASATLAAGDPYAEASAAYKAELKRDELPNLNTRFIADLATSQARRKSRSGDEGGLTSLPTNARANTDGGVRFASPTINGTVRGDVNIIVQQDAVRGGIIAIQ